MTLIVVLIILGIVSVAVSSLAKRCVEDTIPVIILSIIAVLYPFYCMDMLMAGELTIYVLFLFAVIAFVYTVRKKKTFEMKEMLTLVSPGVLVFAGVCIFYLFYLHDNRVELWDELRLWGAVPKALHKERTLQLGEDAWIFPIMQSYPPAMPLLVYFFTARASSFPEYQIFFVYAIFVSALILPVYKNLSWKQWPKILPAAVFMIWLPCIFTSHGGDYGWFYESLFIDPVLGVLIGYVFYQSLEKPFSNGFTQYRFFVSLLVLALIKDSGAAFAVIAAANALILYYRNENGSCGIRTVCFKAVLTISPILIGYGGWKLLLKKYGIYNHVGMSSELLSFDAIKALFESLISVPMLSINGGIFSSELKLTFVPCFIGLVYLSIWINRKSKRFTNAQLTVTWLCMVTSFCAFFLGYCMSFGEYLPSFARYVSTILFAVLVFDLFQFAEILDRIMPTCISKVRSRTGIGAAAWVLLLCFSGSYFVNWEENKVTMSDYENEIVSYITYEIKQNAKMEEAPYSDYYLLIAEEQANNSRIHHRIYFDLIGSYARIHNFWSEANITGSDHPMHWTDAEITDIAEKWGEYIIAEGYEYVCVVILDDYATSILEKLGVEHPEMGDIYEIVRDESGYVRLA